MKKEPIKHELLRQKIRTNEIKVCLQRKKDAKDYIEIFESIKYLKYLLLMPYVLPIIAIIVIFTITGNMLILIVIPCYFLMPIILGRSQMILGLMSTLGLYAVSQRWHPFYIALLLPAVLCNLGYLIYQRALEFVILKSIMNSWDDAVRLEKERFVVFLQEGKIKKLNEIV